MSLPINIATDGYLNSPLSVATDGYLSIVIGDEQVHPPGTARYDERMKWIEHDDELIMLVIRTFLTMKDRE